jgi:hypothetical protein
MLEKLINTSFYALAFHTKLEVYVNSGVFGRQHIIYTQVIIG